MVWNYSWGTHAANFSRFSRDETNLTALVTLFPWHKSIISLSLAKQHAEKYSAKWSLQSVSCMHHMSIMKIAGGRCQNTTCTAWDSSIHAVQYGWSNLLCIPCSFHWLKYSKYICVYFSGVFLFSAALGMAKLGHPPYPNVNSTLFHLRHFM